MLNRVRVPISVLFLMVGLYPQPAIAREPRVQVQRIEVHSQKECVDLTVLWSVPANSAKPLSMSVNLIASAACSERHPNNFAGLSLARGLQFTLQWEPTDSTHSREKEPRPIKRERAEPVWKGAGGVYQYDLLVDVGVLRANSQLVLNVCNQQNENIGSILLIASRKR